MDTRHKLIVEASKLFAQKGFQGTSIRQITDSAQANLGSVTYHFGGKEELYISVLQYKLAPFQAELDKALSTKGSPLDRLECFIRTFLSHLLQDESLYKLCLQQFLELEELPVPAVHWRSYLRTSIAQLIREGQLDGSITNGEPSILGDFCFSSSLFLPALYHEDTSLSHSKIVTNLQNLCQQALASSAER